MPKVNRGTRGGRTTWSIHNRDHPNKGMNHKSAKFRALAWQLGDFDAARQYENLQCRTKSWRNPS